MADLQKISTSDPQRHFWKWYTEKFLRVIHRKNFYMWSTEKFLRVIDTKKKIILSVIHREIISVGDPWKNFSGCLANSFCETHRDISAKDPQRNFCKWSREISTGDLQNKFLQVLCREISGWDPLKKKDSVSDSQRNNFCGWSIEIFLWLTSKKILRVIHREISANEPQRLFLKLIHIEISAGDP